MDRALECLWYESLFFFIPPNLTGWMAVLELALPS